MMATSVAENAAIKANCTVSNQAVELKLPANCEYVVIRFNTNVGKYSYNGTDGVAIGSNYIQMSAGAMGRIYTDGYSSIYIATLTVPTVVDLWAVLK